MLADQVDVPIAKPGVRRPRRTVKQSSNGQTDRRPKYNTINVGGGACCRCSVAMATHSILEFYMDDARCHSHRYSLRCRNIAAAANWLRCLLLFASDAAADANDDEMDEFDVAALRCISGRACVVKYETRFSGSRLRHALVNRRSNVVLL